MCVCTSCGDTGAEPVCFPERFVCERLRKCSVHDTNARNTMHACCGIAVLVVSLDARPNVGWSENLSSLNSDFTPHPISSATYIHRHHASCLYFCHREGLVLVILVVVIISLIHAESLETLHLILSLSHFFASFLHPFLK